VVELIPLVENVEQDIADRSGPDTIEIEQGCSSQLTRRRAQRKLVDLSLGKGFRHAQDRSGPIADLELAKRVLGDPAQLLRRPEGIERLPIERQQRPIGLEEGLHHLDRAPDDGVLEDDGYDQVLVERSGRSRAHAAPAVDGGSELRVAPPLLVKGREIEGQVVAIDDLVGQGGEVGSIEVACSIDVDVDPWRVDAAGILQLQPERHATPAHGLPTDARRPRIVRRRKVVGLVHGRVKVERRSRHEV